MGIFKRLLFSGTSSLPIGWLKERSPVRLLIPYHHLVSDERVAHIERLYSFKNTRQFEKDLDYLLTHFKALSLQEIIQYREKGLSPPATGFLVTFDDGLRQVYEIAAPILWRKGVPAAVFINPPFVDNKDIFYDFKKGLILDKLDNRLIDKKLLSSTGNLFGRVFTSSRQLQAAVRSINYLNKHLVDEIGQLLEIDFESFRKKERPCMTLSQLKELAGRGFAIGSHSMDHPLYSLISPEEQIRQTLESTHWVTRSLDLPYKAFAFPHVDTGVGNALFEQLVGQFPPALDLVLANQTGMLEKHPRVLHRFIGENPAIPMERMAKAVLSYGMLLKGMNRQFVKRYPHPS